LLALLLPHLFATTPDPLYFEPNLGQSGPLTRFVARTRGAASLIQDDGIVLRRGVSEVRLTWEDTDPNARWMHPEAGPGVTSYIRGNRADHWIHNIPHYSRVTRVGVYPGTDLILYGSEGRLEFDFVLAPGAAPERIQFTLSGLDGLAIDSNGDLAAGTFLQRKPRVYQNGREIEARYRLIAPNRVAFELGTYDPGAPLTIDPVLESATLLGGSGDDRIIAADPSNRIVGTTTSTDFPGLDSGGRQGTDIFVYDPVKQSTVIVGGSGDDIVTCAIIGPPGYQVTIAGYTNSRDFPVTTFASSNGSPQPLQPTYGGGDWDGFLLTLSGAFPIFGTYVGGSGDDRVLSLGANYYDYFAVGGSTTSTDFPLAAAWQSRPGGGVDGFLQLIQVFRGLMLSTYLGGSGDDRVTALTTSTSGQDLWLAGETRSADWQPPGVWSGVLNGPSDGFLLHAIVNSTLPQAQPAAGIYLGGSADDRVTALALLPNGNLAAAGVTSSTDLPVAHALQSAYGGGESDGFLAQFSPDLKTLLSATYLGGSGAEEPLALATNNFNEVLAGGWTTSPDFPVTAGLESSCGRGAQDGFLAHFDTSGQSIFATCYGGKGNDRVTAVGSDSAQHDFIAGYSESVDLPLQNAVQPLNAGSNDGFYASFTTAFIHANDLSVGRDLAGSIAVSLGDSTNYVGVTLIATSADPSSVLLAVRPDEPGQTAITLAKGVVSNFGNRNFLAYCLTDAALVPVTLSAPGYATRTINVRCVPSGLVINRTDVAAGAGTSITVVPSAIDPDTHLVLATQNPRGGLDPIHVAVSNPAPDLINFSTASATADQFTTLPLSLPFTMKAAGSADVAFSSNSAIPFVPGNVVHIHGNPLQFTGMSILRGARDLMVPVYLLFPAFPPNATFPVTLTSSDPSKVLISPTSVQHGQPTLTNGTYSGPGSVVAWLEILDTGPVTITATSPGMDPVTAPVAIGELAVGFFYPFNGTQPIQNYSLGLNQSVDFGLRLYVYPIDIVFFQDPRVQRPGVAPVTVQVQSTNPQAIVPDYSGPFPLTLAANETLYHIGLTAAKTGTSVLSVLGISGKIRSSSLTVQSFGPGITLSPITLGKDMMLSIYPSIIGSFPNGISLKLTSADPSKVVFSTDVTKVGQGSITTSTTPIIIQGLADSGVVEITAEILNGGGTSKTTVTLTPSGFAWYPPAWSPSSSSGFFPSVFAYALDPVTLVPLVSQGLRPGLSGSVDLQVADSSVVSASPLSLPLATLSTSSGVTIRSAAGGDTQIAIVQPPGFVQPTGRGPLRLHLPSPLLNSSFPAVGRNLEASASIQFGNPFSSAVTATPPITVTSGDSSRLLLSLNSSIPGSASVVSNFRNGNYVPVYLQALDGPVDVPVTLSADGAKDVTAVVQILPSGISLQTPDYPYTFSPRVRSRIRSRLMPYPAL
jgi:hypothetical protein